MRWVPKKATNVAFALYPVFSISIYLKHHKMLLKPFERCSIVRWVNWKRPDFLFQFEICVLFSMQIEEFDQLPNYICVDCWMTMEKFYEFYKNVSVAQKSFLFNEKNTIKLETPQDESDHAIYYNDCKLMKFSKIPEKYRINKMFLCSATWTIKWCWFEIPWIEYSCRTSG